MVESNFQNYLLKNFYILLLIGAFTVVAYAWLIAIDTYLETVFARRFGYDFWSATLLTVFSALFIISIGQSVKFLPAFSVDDQLIDVIAR